MQHCICRHIKNRVKQLCNNTTNQKEDHQRTIGIKGLIPVRTISLQDEKTNYSSYGRDQKSRQNQKQIYQSR